MGMAVCGMKTKFLSLTHSSTAGLDDFAESWAKPAWEEVNSAAIKKNRTSFEIFKPVFMVTNFVRKIMTAITQLLI
jgi:hypothetical protein